MTARWRTLAKVEQERDAALERVRELVEAFDDGFIYHTPKCSGYDYSKSSTCGCGAAQAVEKLRKARAALAPTQPDRGQIPRDFWREVPCGHPPDPVAAVIDGGYVCHCGWVLDPDDLGLPEKPPEAPGPIVNCSKCGCYVALPAQPDRE